MFHRDPAKARIAYRAFVAAGIDSSGHVPVPGTVTEV
jgi:hypothetical protein